MADTAAPPPERLGRKRVVGIFVRLRWRLLRGAVRRGGADQVGAVVSTVASALVGIGGAVAIALAGRTTDDPTTFAVLVCTLVLLAVAGFGVVAGVAQPVDPRVVAAEPLSDAERSLGVLATAAFGPPGLAGITIGIGLTVAVADGSWDAPLAVIGVGSWLASLLLVARTATNLLSILLNRMPRVGQLVVGAFGIAFYGTFQLVPAVLGDLDPDRRAGIADVLAWTPPGRIGRAITDGSVVDLVLGSAWLPLLAWGFTASERRLATSVRHGGELATSGDASGVRRIARRLAGSGPAGAIAWRSLLIRFRSPRTALETVTGAAIGIGAVLAPAILRDDPGSGAVLVGGAVQLAVLFMSGNSFGSEGPGLTHELLTGVPAGEVVTGKFRSIVLVATPLAVIGPVLAASLTGEWRYLPAGCFVGLAGLLAGSGAAIVQSVMVPIAVPESDNPFASGETGKGVVAALLLVAVLSALAVTTVPVALALFWASERGRVDLVTLFAIGTVAIGWAVAELGRRIAVHRLLGHEPEFVEALVPAR